MENKALIAAMEYMQRNLTSYTKAWGQFLKRQLGRNFEPRRILDSIYIGGNYR
jgi:hypothetical protein